MILALVLAAMPPEELALRTLVHRVQLSHWVAWKAEREADEERDRRRHNAGGW